MTIFEQSQSWKQQADQILHTTGLQQALEAIGRVEFAGSYAMDLMMAGDIDLYVLSDRDPQTIASAIITAVVPSEFWNYYMIHDWLHFEHPHFPKGYYVGLQRKDYLGHPWKVDMWIFNELPQHVVDYSNWLTSSLTPEIREAILTIKAHVKAIDPKRQSTDIYEAVIKEGVRTVDEFEALAKA